MNPRPSSRKAAKPGARRGDGGAVMLEFVIAFPLVLVLMFACIQFAHLWVAKMVVHYAAFCAARSALVCTTDQYDVYPPQAARAVCDKLSQSSWAAGSGERTRTKVDPNPAWNVTATTRHTFSLITPLVGPIIAWGMEDPGSEGIAWYIPPKPPANIDSIGFPTIELVERVVLPKPYVKMDPAQF